MVCAWVGGLLADARLTTGFAVPASSRCPKSILQNFVWESCSMPKRWAAVRGRCIYSPKVAAHQKVAFGKTSSHFKLKKDGGQHCPAFRVAAHHFTSYLYYTSKALTWGSRWCDRPCLNILFIFSAPSVSPSSPLEYPNKVLCPFHMAMPLGLKY